MVSFLSWAAEPEMEERKLVSCLFLSLFFLVAAHIKLVKILFMEMRIRRPDKSKQLPDGVQMDFCSIIGTSSSWLLQAFEVVSSQVQEACA